MQSKLNPSRIIQQLEQLPIVNMFATLIRLLLLLSISSKLPNTMRPTSLHGTLLLANADEATSQVTASHQLSETKPREPSNRNGTIQNEQEIRQQTLVTPIASNSQQRVGSQSHELLDNVVKQQQQQQPDQESSSPANQMQILLREQVAESRQDLGTHQGNPTPLNHQLAQNHLNYPALDSFSSASFTTPVHSSATVSPLQQSPLLTDNQQQALINALLERDYHQSTLGQSQQSSQRFEQTLDDSNALESNQLLGYDINSSASDTLSKILDGALQGVGGNESQNQYNNNNNNNLVQQVFNHQSEGNQMNANLIQNLTASLFPIKQLSNATLLSLSELLNKTRQHNHNHQHQANQQTAPISLTNTGFNGSKPQPINHNYAMGNFQSKGSQTNISTDLSNGSNGKLHQQSSSLPTTSSQNYLDTLLNDSLLDYIRQQQHLHQQNAAQNNPMGSIQAPDSMARFQSPTTFSSSTISPYGSQSNHLVNGYQQSVVSQMHQQQQPNETPSNLYETYLPYKEMADVPTSGPTTNGQALKMASTLYDSYLDQTVGYRYPLAIGTSGSSNISKSLQGPNLNYDTTNADKQQAYHLIQHHSSNSIDGIGMNQAVDKIVYNSTPFRPNIPSLASSQQQYQQQPFTKLPELAGISANNSNLKNLGGTNQQTRVQASQSDGQRFATYGSNGGKSQSQQLNYNMNPLTDAGQRAANVSGMQSPTARHNNKLQNLRPSLKLTGLLDDDDDDHQFMLMQNGFSELDRPPATLLQQQQQQNQTIGSTDAMNGQQTNHLLRNLQASNSSTLSSNPMSSMSTSKTTHHQIATPTPGSSSAGHQMGPQLLFDMYEREIDNQIREAIYQDHYNQFVRQQQQQATGQAQQQSQASNPILSHANGPTGAISSTSQSWSLDDQVDVNNLMAALGLRSGSVGSGAANDFVSRLPSSSQLSSSTSPANTPAAHQQVESLAAALQELPTYSASDLQPIGPFGAAYSLLGSAITPAPQQQPDSVTETPMASGLSALVSQLIPLGAQTPAPAYNILNQLNQELEANAGLQQSSAVSSLSSYRAQNPKHHTVNTKTQLQSHSGQATQSHTNLPAIILKSFQNPGQISSILASPFAHLYANLPRYRYTRTKKHQSSQLSAPNQSHKLNGHVNQNQWLTSPMASKQNSLWANPMSDMHQQSTISLMSPATGSASPLNPHQIANLLRGLPNGPLGGTSGSFTIETPLGTAGETNLANQSGGQYVESPATSVQQQRQLSAISGLISQLTSGGVGGAAQSLAGPPGWRHLISPMNWTARKQQMLSSLNNINNNNNNNHHHHQQQQQQQQASASLTHQQLIDSPPRSPLGLPLINSLWTSGSSPFSQLFASSSAGVQTALSGLQGSGPIAATTISSLNHQNKKNGSRLKIKILKIPVAVYDQTSIQGAAQLDDIGGHQQIEQQFAHQTGGSSIGLMPAHLQPNPTASLLASLPCVHNQNNQNHHMNPFGGQQGINARPVDQSSFIVQQSQQASSNQQQHQHPLLDSSTGVSSLPTKQHHQSAEINAPSAAGTNLVSPFQSTTVSTTVATTSAETQPKSPSHIQFFTEINQPNDLQVSPSTSATTIQNEAKNRQRVDQSISSNSMTA